MSFWSILKSILYLISYFCCVDSSFFKSPATKHNINRNGPPIFLFLTVTFNLHAFKQICICFPSRYVSCVCMCTELKTSIYIYRLHFISTRGFRLMYTLEQTYFFDNSKVYMKLLKKTMLKVRLKQIDVRITREFNYENTEYREITKYSLQLNANNKMGYVCKYF